MRGSTPQKTNPVGPIPVSRFLYETGQGQNEAANIRWRNRLVIHKDHAGMMASFFGPGF